MIITRTFQIEELVWLIAALIGLGVWLANLGEARKDVAAVKGSGKPNGKLIQAKDSLDQARTWVVTDVMFLVIGGIAAFREPSPDIPIAVRISSAGLFILVSYMITRRGFKWRATHLLLLQYAVKLQVESVTKMHDFKQQQLAQDVVGIAQKETEVRQAETQTAQMATGVAQEKRSEIIDDRAGKQSARGTKQDQTGRDQNQRERDWINTHKDEL